MPRFRVVPRAGSGQKKQLDLDINPLKTGAGQPHNTAG